MDVQLTADLAAAAADGYAALHDALHGVTFAALGRKKRRICSTRISPTG